MPISQIIYCSKQFNIFDFHLKEEKTFTLTRENNVNINDYQTTSKLEKLLAREAAFQISLTIGSSVNSRTNSCNTSVVESNLNKIIGYKTVP